MGGEPTTSHDRTYATNVYSAAEIRPDKSMNLRDLSRISTSPLSSLLFSATPGQRSSHHDPPNSPTHGRPRIAYEQSPDNVTVPVQLPQS